MSDPDEARMSDIDQLRRTMLRRERAYRALAEATRSAGMKWSAALNEWLTASAPIEARQRDLRDFARALPPQTQTRSTDALKAVARVLYEAEQPVSNRAVMEALRERASWHEMFGHLKDYRCSVRSHLERIVEMGFADVETDTRGSRWSWRSIA